MKYINERMVYVIVLRISDFLYQSDEEVIQTNRKEDVREMGFRVEALFFAIKKPVNTG